MVQQFDRDVWSERGIFGGPKSEINSGLEAFERVVKLATPKGVTIEHTPEHSLQWFGSAAPVIVTIEWPEVICIAYGIAPQTALHGTRLADYVTLWTRSDASGAWWIPRRSYSLGFAFLEEAAGLSEIEAKRFLHEAKENGWIASGFEHYVRLFHLTMGLAKNVAPSVAEETVNSYRRSGSIGTAIRDGGTFLRRLVRGDQRVRLPPRETVAPAPPPVQAPAPMPPTAEAAKKTTLSDLLHFVQIMAMRGSWFEKHVKRIGSRETLDDDCVRFIASATGETVLDLIRHLGYDMSIKGQEDNVLSLWKEIQTAAGVEPKVNAVKKTTLSDLMSFIQMGSIHENWHKKHIDNIADRKKMDGYCAQFVEHATGEELLDLSRVLGYTPSEAKRAYILNLWEQIQTAAGVESKIKNASESA